jgi:hypothetical protein
MNLQGGDVGLPGTIWLELSLGDVGISGDGDLGNSTSGSSNSGAGSNSSGKDGGGVGDHSTITNAWNSSSSTGAVGGRWSGIAGE